MCVFGIYEQSVGEGERVSPVRGFRGQASQISSKVGMLGGCGCEADKGR